MTDPDEQLDSALQQALRDERTPPPSGEAKRRAITMARAEFEAAQKAPAEGVEKIAQGLFARLRLIVRNQADKRRATMYASNRLAYGGMTAIALAVIAVGVTTQYQGNSAYEPRVNASFEHSEDARPGYSLRPGREEHDIALQEVIVTARPPAQSEGTPIQASLGQGESPRVQPKASLLANPATRSNVEAYAGRAIPVAAPLTGDAALHAPPDVMPRPGYREEGRDRFEAFKQNPVKLVSEEPVSTFSADVDTASYSFVRRMLNSGVLPQPDAVRAEELINYFDYDYPLPASRAEPFQPSVAVSDSPWAEGRKLMYIGIKGYDIAPQATPRSNLVFLLDVSGSMNSPDKLPLVKQSMEMLLSTLHPDDTVAIAVYAGAAGTVLEPTPVKNKQKILRALRNLSAGGSTAGGQGIRLAYEMAASSYDENAVNRVILATDGDFNVGITSDRELKGFIERKRDEGIFLSVLGFGRGNYQDARMQALAQNGNGVAAYIDTLGEAQKVLVEQATASLFPIAKDVKFQVEFNPATVAEYRLIGYETRRLTRADFNNDAVDAGDMGAGHAVTAIYEFTPVGSAARIIDESRYAPSANTAMESLGTGSEYAFLKIRYKLPDEDVSKLITRPVTGADSIELASCGLGREAGFATAVAGFSQLLKGGRYTGSFDYDDVIQLALATRGDDPYGYRNEFVQLARKARTAAAMR